eukprot:TRINITY_DN2984_c0_g1_i2.p2 TRINITY_DN2984_c0_g1~~TRINITY_DN2984_c0_g1_i2.p2  ORF type:complete len:563 (+),score=106.59 TRINITY_DN2984_c0_g1_i2:3-1691(+)
MRLILTLLVTLFVFIQCTDSADCTWKQWGQWGECLSKGCGAEMKTRTRVCGCTDISKCTGDAKETVYCNRTCTRTEVYWKETHGHQTAASVRYPWPISEDTKFSCKQSLGSPNVNLTWLDVLKLDKLDDWSRLAKQFITAKLNLRTGAVTTTDVKLAVYNAEKLLDYCDNFTATQIQQSSDIIFQLSSFNDGLSDVSEGSCFGEIPCCYYGWEDWTPCSESCGDGISTRSPKCICNDGRSYGDISKCSDYLGLPPAPEVKKCSVDCCKWTEWLAWTSCSQNCGVGVRTRQKDCVCNPGATTQNCEGAAPVETMECEGDSCCEWEFEEWGECSKMCGGGVMKRNPIWKCEEGSRYQEPLEVPPPPQSIGCNPELCCDWNMWSEWSVCNNTCGNGITSRRKLCHCINTNETDDVFCHGESVVENHVCTGTSSCCEWGEWSDWGTCINKEGVYVKERARSTCMCNTANGRIIPSVSSNCAGTMPTESVSCKIDSVMISSVDDVMSNNDNDGDDDITEPVRPKIITIKSSVEEMPKSNAIDVCVINIHNSLSTNFVMMMKMMMEMT